MMEAAVIDVDTSGKVWVGFILLWQPRIKVA